MDIAAIDYWANSRTSVIHRASPLGKGLAALAFVAAVVLATSPYLLLAVYLLLLAGVFATRLPAIRLVMIAAYPTLFALLFAVSRWNGDLVTPAVILLKALTAAQAMVILITTTPYPDIFAGLGKLMPRLLADGLFITYRSFFLLLREMGRMLKALRLRGGMQPGRPLQQLGNVSRALGSLLVRAIDLSERLYAVLRVRGYRGRLRTSDRWRRLSPSDALPMGAGLAALLLAVVARSWPGLWLALNGPAVLASGALAVVAYLLTRGGGEESGRVNTQGDTLRNNRASPASDRQPAHPANGGHQFHGDSTSTAEVARVSCVRHLYPDGTEVSLCGLDFVAHQGERVVILGPNGAGKSTLLNHLLGLLRPTEGEVSVLGHDPTREFSAIQPRLGVLLQNVDEQLLGPTVADDVAFGARNAGLPEAECRRRAETVMARLGVLSLAEKVPHYLSGGEKRKVALAGALVTDPELLVLDEPFEGLDPRSRGDLVELLTELHRERGMTVILTTHHVDMLPVLADTVYVLAEGGRIVARGAPLEVFAESELLKESSIEPPALNMLFQKLKDAGLDVESPVDVDDAASQLIQLSRQKTG